MKVYLYVDEHFTRRKRIHRVIVEGGDQAFTGPRIGACVEWLYDNGYMEFEMITENHTFAVSIRYLRASTE